jgi:Ribonuclease G/E
MSELLKDTLTQLLSVILTGAITIASAYMTVFVAKATEKAKLESKKIEDERQRRMLQDALDKLDSLLKTNIIALENTIKKEMLEAIADGKIEKDELKTLAVKVKENVLIQLGNDSMDILCSSIGDVNGYLEARVEELLVQIKNEMF